MSITLNRELSAKGHAIRRIATAAALTLLVAASSSEVLADTGSKSDPLEGLSFGATAYVDYSNGQSPLPGGKQADYNQFALTRGYFTMKKKFNDWMSMQLTMDIHQDDTGDYKRREKYYYAELRPGDVGILTNMKSEIGMGHIPWLDFEEHVNLYRCQGTMPVERAGTFNSSDLGASLRGYFGETMEDAQAKTGNKEYAGRYGSWHFGVYNGGGYHAKEANENKLFEGRVTVRPVSEALPGLQVSYLGIFGEGNVAPKADASVGDGVPDYNVHLGMLSYEHPACTLTAQYFTTDGNAKGKWVDEKGSALETAGYSLFGNLKLDGKGGRWNVFGRYDHFDADKDDVLADLTAYDMVIGGIALDLHKGNLVTLTFESTSFEDDFGLEKGERPSTGNKIGDERKVQVVYQIKL